MNEVITDKRVIRDDAGSITDVKLYTNRGRVYEFAGRNAALAANSRFQRLQSITPASVEDIRHTISARGKRAA